MASESTEKKETKEVKVVTTIKTDVIEGETTGSEGAGDTKKKTTKKSTSKKSTTKNKGWGHTLAICGSILGGALIMCLCRHCKGGKGCVDCGCDDEPQRDTTEMVNNPQQPVDSAKFVNYANISIETDGDVGNVTINQIYAERNADVDQKVNTQSANHSDGAKQCQDCGGRVSRTPRQPKPVVDTTHVIVYDHVPDTPKPEPCDCDTTVIRATQVYVGNVSSLARQRMGIKVY